MMDRPSTEFRVSTGPSPEADAEEAFQRVLTGESAALLDRAMLLISELLASEEGSRSIGGGHGISLKVLSLARSVRVEVRDGGTGVVLGGLRKPHGPSSHGWSPHLLSRIADRWGLVSGADGAWVWFELDLPRGAT
jgi:hypothetical protein